MSNITLCKTNRASGRLTSMANFPRAARFVLHPTISSHPLLNQPTFWIEAFIEEGRPFWGLQKWRIAEFSHFALIERLCSNEKERFNKPGSRWSP
jgi:hypothetical protein